MIQVSITVGYGAKCMWWVLCNKWDEWTWSEQVRAAYIHLKQLENILEISIPASACIWLTHVPGWSCACLNCVFGSCAQVVFAVLLHLHLHLQRLVHVCLHVMFTYRYIHTCMHAYMYIFLHVCLHTYAHIYMNVFFINILTFLHMYVNTYIHAHVHLHKSSMSAYMYVRVYNCLTICTTVTIYWPTHTHVRFQQV